MESIDEFRGETLTTNTLPALKLRAIVLALLMVLSIPAATAGGFVGTAEAKGHEISDWNDLHAVRNDLTADYVLVNDLNESTAGYDSVANWTANGGNGFQPIGTSSSRFSGSFDGNGHTISGLNIDRSGEDYVGLFGAVADVGVVKDVKLEGAEVIGNDRVGALVGNSRGGVSNASASGNVTGNRLVGGLIGWSDGPVSDSSASVDVDGSGDDVGGLIGDNFGGEVTRSSASGDVVGGGNHVGGLIGAVSNTGVHVTDSRATGDVAGSIGHVGGLVGFHQGHIANSSATGEVDGIAGGTSRYVGGLVGSVASGTVTNSYATGNVTSADANVGGLVGQLNTNGKIVNDSYATGGVQGDGNVGGVVGLLDTGEVARTYAVGPVTGNTNVGGVVGNNQDTAIDSYWDTATTGRVNGTGTGDDSGLQGLDTSDMKGGAAETNMTAFDFTATWDAVDDGTNVSYPYLLNNSQDPAPGLESPAAGPGSFINGTVTDTSGAPVDGVTVDVVTDPTGTFVDSATTDANGNYSVEVSAGSYEVAVTDPEYDLAVEPGVTVPESGTATVDFTLRRKNGTGFVNGTVEDSNGAAVSSANVLAADSSFTNFGSDTTDGSGSFSVEVREGIYSVRVDAQGHPSKVVEDVDVTENQTTQVTITLEAAAHANGTVTAADGSAPSNAFVVVETGQGVIPGQVDSTTGNYNVTVPPGTHTVTVFANSGTVPSEQISVTAGAVNETDFQLLNTTVVHQSVEIVNGPGNDANLGIRAGLRGGFLQAQVVDESSYNNPGLGKPSELEGLGVDETTTLRMNVTVRNFTANSLLWGLDDARWNTSPNATVRNGTDITIRGSPATMQVNFNRPEVGPLIDKDPSQVQWPTGSNDRATDGRNQTVYVGLFDLGSMPAEVRNSLNGMSVTTNAQTFSIPSVRNDTLRVWVAAPTLTVGGNEHGGFYQADIPEDQLDEWGVSDPESELNALYKGSSADFTVTDTDDGARIRIDNISYSAGYVEVAADPGTDDGVTGSTGADASGSVSGSSGSDDETETETETPSGTETPTESDTSTEAQAGDTTEQNPTTEAATETQAETTTEPTPTTETTTETEGQPGFGTVAVVVALLVAVLFATRRRL